MKHLTIGFIIALIPSVSSANESEASVQGLAQANGFKPSKRIVKAIVNAAKTYDINPTKLTAIAIVETGLGRYERTVLNKNGTKDVGLFQINEVNHEKCVEYNLESPEGSALCAAKLLSSLKKRHDDFLGRYHSNTPKHKQRYQEKIKTVLAKGE